MTMAANECRRELAYRTDNGIEVSLLWRQTSNQITIELIDGQNDEQIEFDVAAVDALDAFYHPYAYTERHRLRVRSAIGEAVAT